MVSYRLANEADYERINSFYNRIYQANRTIEQFRWEFHDCPHGSSIYVIAEDEGKVVGTNCVIPVILVDSAGKEYRTGKSEDTLVDPDYRGQKIFYNIYDFLFEKSREGGIEMIWGFTSAKKPFKKIGFEIPFDQKQSLVVNKPLKAYKYLVSLNSKNQLIQKFKIFGLTVLSKIRGLAKLSFGSTKLKIKTEVLPDLDLMNLIINDNLKAASLFGIRQDQAFQKWRIYDNPNYKQVKVYSLFDDDVLKAQVAFNIDQSGVAHNCQSLFSEDVKMDDKVRIMKSVTKRLFKEKVCLVRNWHFDTNEVNLSESDIYASAGYTVLNRGIGFVWKVMGDESLDPNQFYLSRIASQGT